MAIYQFIQRSESNIPSCGTWPSISSYRGVGAIYPAVVHGHLSVHTEIWEQHTQLWYMAIYQFIQRSESNIPSCGTWPSISSYRGVGAIYPAVVHGHLSVHTEIWEQHTQLWYMAIYQFIQRSESNISSCGTRPSISSYRGEGAIYPAVVHDHISVHIEAREQYTQLWYMTIYQFI